MILMYSAWGEKKENNVSHECTARRENLGLAVVHNNFVEKGVFKYTLFKYALLHACSKTKLIKLKVIFEAHTFSKSYYQT